MARQRRAGSGRGRFVCPHCWEEVPAGARACPHCGSDEKTGWSEDADKWAAGIPTGYGAKEDFDYDEFIAREFGRRRPRLAGLPYWLVALIVALLCLALLVLV